MKLTGIVDSHVHFWNPQAFRYPWLDDLPVLNRAFLPETFSQASAGAGVAKMVFVECGREVSESLQEVDWVSGLAKADPRLCAIVAHASLENGSAARAELDSLAGRPLVKGVRRLLQGEPEAGFCLWDGFVAGVKLLAEYAFTFDLCIRHDQLRAVTELVRRVPEVNFVLDHFGKPPVREATVEPWAADLKALGKLSNVSCKISGLTTEADWAIWSPAELRPYFDTVLEAFGFDRILFGGDWPVCTLATDYQRWIETVAGFVDEASPDERDKLFRSNAERIYRI